MTARAVCLRIIAVLLSLSWLLGCSNEPAKQNVALPAENPGAACHVAILGDVTRNDLLRNLANAHGVTVKASGVRKVAEAGSLRFLSSDEDSISVQAALAWDADLILLAVDATQGPLPVHREHVLVSRQMAAPVVVIAFTKSRSIDDPGLLELEELEMRELLNTYALPGDTAPCVFDHQATKIPAGSKASKGPLQIVASLGAIAKKRYAPDKTREEKRFKASIYSLTAQEAFMRDVALPVKSGPATALVGSESVAAEITAAREIAPGENGEVEILFERPIRVGDGQRFLLMNRQHVSAAGFFLAKDAASR
jgi:translation elongation factor EF-Tu-like GTPase